MLQKLKEFKLPEIEEKVLKFWKENKIFEKTQTADMRGLTRKVFRFFEGPPTANGQPHMGHAEGRAFKDIIPRYKTMRGFFVRRKAGWDTQGLPVEIEVEKELGLKNKQEIEKFGIAEFNEKAKASVWKYQDEWEKFTDRIGFWLDLKNPYITYKPDYIESLWWIFKEIAKRGLLTQSFKIVPYCTRCQTPLSSHELGMPGAYHKVKDPSVYVKFELKPSLTKASAGKSKGNEYLLIWTTTPWTLPANVAIAVNPKLTYTKYKIGNEYLWSYNAPPTIDNVKYEVIEKMSGKKLIGLKYKQLFNVKGAWQKNSKFFKVCGADFVSTEEGTGLVHIAPAFGENDMKLMQEVLSVKSEKLKINDIPITVDDRGMVAKGLPGAGKPAKTADRDIVSHLEKTKALLKAGSYEHEYPFCWRCDTPLLYMAKFSWFIEMSKLRDEIIANGKKINWVPEHIKQGRFGEWLKEVKDWSISRNRYWGTPLPIWQHANGARSAKASRNANAPMRTKEQCGHTEVIGSLEDLDKLRYSQNNFWLLRHGEAEHNLNNLIASGPEHGKNISRLTIKGKKNAESAAINLKKELGNKKLDFIFASPYNRTKETAKIAAKITKSRVIIDKRLSEINCGIFNWRPVEEHHKFHKNDLERFTKICPGGENLNEVKKRMLEAIIDINSRYNGKNILIVSHGDPLWVLEGAMRGLSNEEILKLNYIKVNGIAKKTELHNWPYNPVGELDLHRPYMDKIHLKCAKCDGKMIRVKEVADIWFDSGAMPYAQWHYPFENKDLIDKQLAFPADYISEGIDQTRGWFYSLLAIATLLKKNTPYLNVVTQGHILDKFGKKMSKSRGNAINPREMMDKYGADTLRWYFYTQTIPGEPKVFDELDLGKTLRKFIMIIYNSFVFWNTYAEKTSNSRLPTPSTNILDRWIISKLNKTAADATENLEKYDISGSAKSIEIFVDDLSRWYIRRSRSRLQKPKNKNDFKSASETLYYSLFVLSKLIAPFTPFFAEALYLSLTKNKNQQIKNSVHLDAWPKADEKEMDYSLLEKMEEVRRISGLALALRAEKGVKVRQPLKTLEIKSSKIDARDTELIEVIKNEVNVKKVNWNMVIKNEVNLDFKITP